VFGALAVEARRAALNERAQRARGGIEPGADVYRAMQLAYPAAFAAMIVEGALFRRAATPMSMTAPMAIGLGLFILGKGLKWWAILTLGPSWTFRVIVVPGAPLVTRGPYRFLRHPNYAGVVGELAGVALMCGAVITGPLAMVGFGALMRARIAVEERALRQAASSAPLTSKEQLSAGS
jgi:methyltransferase